MKKIVLDIGTSTMCAALIGEDSIILKEVSIPNLQKKYGADIMSRLTEAAKSQMDMEVIHKALIDSINQVIDILGGDGVEEIVAVGNPAMFIFLYKLDPEPLCVPPYSLDVKEVPKYTADQLGIKLSCPIWMGSPIRGFVGSDTIANIFKHLIPYKCSTLVLDMGTNCEIVLSTADGMWLASVPGGPAYEESHINCGLGANNGSIYQASFEKGRWQFSVIGGGEPKGFCASGLIDVISNLLENNLVDTSGRILEGSEIYLNDYGLKITQKDIRAFQLSKASLQAGIATLAYKAGIDIAQVEQVILTGAFGNGVTVKNGIAIGLIPDVSEEKIKFDSLGPLGGGIILANKVNRGNIFDEIGNYKFVSLPMIPFFQDHFKASLNLKP